MKTSNLVKSIAMTIGVLGIAGIVNGAEIKTVWGYQHYICGPGYRYVQTEYIDRIKVEKGDTLKEIAKKLNCGVNELYEQNKDILPKKDSLPEGTYLFYNHFGPRLCPP